MFPDADGVLSGTPLTMRNTEKAPLSITPLTTVPEIDVVGAGAGGALEPPPPPPLHAVIEIAAIADATQRIAVVADEQHLLLQASCIAMCRSPC